MLFTLLSINAILNQDLEIRLAPIPEKGINSAGRVWKRHEVELSSEKPASIKVMPEVSKPSFGQVIFGMGETERHYDVILDEPTDVKRKDVFGKEIQQRVLYVDVNRNGDLTDDKPVKHSLGVLDDYRETSHTFEWNFNLDVAQGGTDIAGSVRFEYFVPGHVWTQDAGRLKFTPDFGLAGEAKIGGKTYKAALRDIGPRGSFAPYEGRVAILWFDRDDDGRMDFSYEGFNIDQPFAIDGVTYVVKEIDSTGAYIRLSPSRETVLEKPVPSTFIPKVGKVMPTFYSQTVDGKGVQIPGSYRGKVLLLDYWATWCGPCLAEAPNFTKSVAPYLDKGLEVLGITLDDPDKAPEIKKVAEKYKLSWPHAYDGQAWKSPLVVNMRVTEIPSAFLVDGDTGVILAMGDDLHGKKLATTLARVMKDRTGKASPAATP